MANYKTGSDLVAAALNIAGELADGTSNYQADALTYLNLAYKGVLTGGNVFGIDVADPWTWALARRPIIFTMNPAIINVNATVTQFSFNGTFSSAPQNVAGSNISVQNWWLNVGSRDEWFMIKSHAAGSTSFQLDMPYTEQNIIASTAKIVQLDYDLVDDSVVVDAYNQKIDFSEGGGSTLVATLTTGIYTPSSYATMVATALHSAGALTYTGAWNTTTRLFTWSATGVFNLLNASGINAPYNASWAMGLDMIDLTGAQSYTALYPLNAINRLTSPMLCYRKPNTPWRNPKNEGKIYEISFNTFTREYPLTMMQSGTPDKFAIVNTSPTGIVTIRLNGYMTDLPTRVEVGYIPKRQDLQNNSVSIPVVPEEHRKFLTDAAAFMLQQDKADSKAEKQELIAAAGLKALQHSDRKSASLAGINYGKLVPRYGMTQKRWWWQIT